jgi:hypothetical protein
MTDSPDSSSGAQNSSNRSHQPEPLPPVQPIDAELVPETEPRMAQPDYDARGVPSLDYVRNKIESRYATSLGAAELAEGTAEGRTLEEQEAERERAATAKLDEIRRSLGR